MLNPKPQPRNVNADRMLNAGITYSNVPIFQ